MKLNKTLLSTLVAISYASAMANAAEPLQAQAFRDMAAAKAFAGIAAKDAQIADQALTAARTTGDHALILKAQQNFRVKQDALSFASRTVSSTAAAYQKAQQLDSNAAIKSAMVAPTPVPAPQAPAYKVPNAPTVTSANYPAPKTPAVPQTLSAVPSKTPNAPAAPVTLSSPKAPQTLTAVPTVKPQTPAAPAIPSSYASASTPATPKPVIIAPPSHTPVVAPAPVAAYAVPSVKPQTPNAPKVPAKPVVTAPAHLLTQAVDTGAKQVGLTAPVQKTVTVVDTHAQTLTQSAAPSTKSVTLVQSAPVRIATVDGKDGKNGLSGRDGKDGVTTVRTVNTYVVDTQTRQQVQGQSRQLANHDQRITKMENNFQSLKSEVDSNRERSDAMIAGVAAQANIPQVTESQTVMFGAGVGAAGSQQAVAVGASFHAGHSVIVKASISADTNDNFVMGAGAGFGF
ncbi:YadA-like family protein [Enterobacter mori]